MKEKQVRTLRRRLFFDIEVSANIALIWQSGFKISVSPESIIKERAIICICYKWEDSKEVEYLTWDSKQCDKRMLQKFVEVANSADQLIGHNGDRFDLSWVRTRCLFHGIQMFPNYTIIDTLKVSRSKFKFNSNKLDYIAKFLGVGKKIKTDYSMWKDIMLDKDKIAMDKMVKYCKMDVIVLEKVYKALSSHIEPKTHFGVIFGGDRGSCPECGSDQITISKRRTTATGIKKIQYVCKVCFKMHSKTDK
jgi:DNA polymerase elongation subunit (family B)